VPGTEGACIDCRRRAAGLEAGHRLEHSRMSGLILIPIKAVNETKEVG
jgi:hypothetical protein